MKKKEQHVKGSTESKADMLSPWKALTLHLICGFGLASSLWISRHVYALNMIPNPAPALRLIWVIEAPVVILLYSVFRKAPDHCSYLKAVGRGLLALPAGAVVNAFGAVALGAPVGIQNFQKTLNWSLLMSAFTINLGYPPIVCSPKDFFACCSKGNESRLKSPIFHLFPLLLFMAHLGSIGIKYLHTQTVIGAWFGAWPMPLDWERLWQEWPICVTYGAVGGYLIGMIASSGFVLFHGLEKQRKIE